MPVCEKPVFLHFLPLTFFLTVVPEKKTDLVWCPHADHHHTHRDGRLYQPHYPSFEAYCSQHWELSRSRAYQLMDASTVVSNLSTTGDTTPTNERQARELVILDPEAQRIMWQSYSKPRPVAS